MHFSLLVALALPDALIELSKPPTKPECILQGLRNEFGLRFNKSGAQCRPCTRKSDRKCCNLVSRLQDAFCKVWKTQFKLFQFCSCPWPCFNGALEATDQAQMHFPRPEKSMWPWFQQIWRSMPSLIRKSSCKCCSLVSTCIFQVLVNVFKAVLALQVFLAPVPDCLPPIFAFILFGVFAGTN